MHVCRCTDMEGSGQPSGCLPCVCGCVLHTSGQLAQGLPGDATGSLPSQLWSACISDAHHNL